MCSRSKSKNLSKQMSLFKIEPNPENSYQNPSVSQKAVYSKQHQQKLEANHHPKLNKQTKKAFDPIHKEKIVQIPNKKFQKSKKAADLKLKIQNKPTQVSKKPINHRKKSIPKSELKKPTQNIKNTINPSKKSIPKKSIPKSDPRLQYLLEHQTRYDQIIAKFTQINDTIRANIHFKMTNISLECIKDQFLVQKDPLQQKFDRVIALGTEIKQKIKRMKQENTKRQQQLKMEAQNLKKEIEKLSKKIEQARIEVLQSNNKMKEQSLNTRNEGKPYSKYFFANILQDESLFQEYLANIVQKLTGKIKQTKLIYQWNPLHKTNKTNIHDYIHGIEHLVFLIRTQQDYHIAAYTQKPFSQSIRDPGAGAIISLTNRRAFPVKPGQRAISYDRYYIRFGNSQLQIKGDDINSNLGAAGSYYQTGSERADILFGRVQKSMTKILEMEIFQALF